MIKMYKTFKIFKVLFPKYIWEIPNNENKVYLTFDDGPIPEVTEWVLDILKKEEIKATFFCIGDNIKKHPEVFRRVIAENHAIGNHTFNHLNGWKNTTEEYLNNVLKCENIINKQLETTNKTKLFRPPFGKIKSAQAKMLLKLNYKIIMWDVLSYDFNKNISAENCFTNTLENITPGSIIVFHDSIKASTNLKAVLPKLIQEIKKKGYLFEKIH